MADHLLHWPINFSKVSSKSRDDPPQLPCTLTRQKQTGFLDFLYLRECPFFFFFCNSFVVVHRTARRCADRPHPALCREQRSVWLPCLDLLLFTFLRTCFFSVPRVPPGPHPGRGGSSVSLSPLINPESTSKYTAQH